jgi:elongator complex protein 3
MGHPGDKVELIIMGGTFPASPPDYQYEFIKACYDALNGCISANLEEAKHINETAVHRCVGLCIETRPDWCSEDQVKRMLEFGATRVELGVQAIDNSIYDLVRRGHVVEDVIKATELCKCHGLKVYYHWMPGLPGSSPEHDLQMTGELFNNDSYKPDGLKLYPALVIANTELNQWYSDGKYKPYTLEEMSGLLIDIKQLVPAYVRIPRVMRDIPRKFIIAGCQDLALRGSLKKAMLERRISCKCTRCREFGHRLSDGWPIGEPALHRYDYIASCGKEIFLSFEDDNETLFGLLRLRLKTIGNDVYPAMVREIHVFGAEVPLGAQDVQTAQHRGLGARLLAEAERIACDEFEVNKIAVISGVGARKYFEIECGYQLEGHYMTKKL